VAGVEAYLHDKFHLDPPNRLATIHQRYRQDKQDRTDRQLSDRIGRTVLQTAAQKLQRQTLSKERYGPDGSETMFQPVTVSFLSDG